MPVELEVMRMTVLDVRLPATPSEVGVWPDLHDRDVRAELTPAAIRAVARVADRWRLTVGDVCSLLGAISESSWHSWQRSAPAALSVDQLTRVSLLLGIYTSLHVLHPGPLADEWVRRTNSNVLFLGRTPLDVMRVGGIPAMLEVRALLDGRRGGL